MGTDYTANELVNPSKIEIDQAFGGFNITIREPRFPGDDCIRHIDAGDYGRYIYYWKARDNAPSDRLQVFSREGSALCHEKTEEDTLSLLKRMLKRP